MSKRNFERKKLQFYPKVELVGFAAEVRLVDISANGLLLVSTEEFYLNDDLILKIKDAEIAQHFDLKVVVKRCKKINEQQYEIGCQYEKINPEEIIYLLSYIRKNS